ncbi:43kDa postsynaptic protein [Trema orientale]|uniref:RING-type E3 ubiquitin transferase n=1 Tax=Trema orientale TaxID=63057 RepID=A0A2P5EM55_TREOI|nr:43kDa postsynaptic protein [Trema orientale]
MRSASEETQPLQWHYTVLDDRNFEIRGRTLFFVIVVFSVLLVVTLLFLYARWVCRYRHATTFPAASTSHAPRAALAPSQGLDAAAIMGLPIVLHQSGDPGDEAGPGRVSGPAECCICLGVFEDGEKLKVLPQCCHCYHPECVDRWLSTQSSCPLCRASLRVDPAVPKIVVVE